MAPSQKGRLVQDICTYKFIYKIRIYTFIFLNIHTYESYISYIYIYLTNKISNYGNCVQCIIPVKAIPGAEGRLCFVDPWHGEDDGFHGEGGP